MRLISLSYVFCLILQSAVVVAIVLNLKNSLNLFKQINLRQWILLLLIFLIALGIRIWVIPHEPVLFYDEYEHIAIGKNMLENHCFARPDFYLDGKFYSSYLPQWLPGLHFIMSEFFFFFGATPEAAFNLNACLSAFSVVLLFLCVYLMTLNFSKAYLSSMLLTFLPLHLKFSGNISLEAGSLFFILATLLSSFIFIRLQTLKSFFMVLAFLSFALMVRAENVLLIPLLIFLFFQHKIPMKKAWKLLPVILLLSPCFFYLAHIRSFMIEHWLPGRLNSSVWTMFFSSILFWIQDTFVPVSVVFFAALGIVNAVKHRNRIQIWGMVYFLTFLSFYVFFEKLDLSHGSSLRFNVLLCIPILWLAPEGLEYFYLLFLKFKKLIVVVLFFLLVLNYYKCSSYVFSDVSDSALIKQYRSVKNSRCLFNDCIFFSYNPSFALAVTGQSSVHLSYLFNEKIFEKYLKNRCLIFLNDYWCLKDKGGFCARLNKIFHTETVEVPGGQGLFKRIVKKM